MGYDGSLMNGLQSLPQWQSNFNHPSNGMLGVLNAVQVAFSLKIIISDRPLTIVEHWSFSKMSPRSVSF